jgi:histidine triad (HIT) family protein
MSPGADQALAALARAVAESSKRLVRALGADGLSIVQSNGAAAGQEVFHLHQHLIPRWNGDPRLTVWEQDEIEARRVDLTYNEVVRP